MNTDALATLAGRWPKDIIVVSPTIFGSLFKNNGNSAYIDFLQIAPDDQLQIQSFARANNFSYLAVSKEDLRFAFKTKPWKQSAAWPGLQTASTLPVLAHQISGTLYNFPVAFCLAYYAGNSDEKTTDATIEHKSIIRVTLSKIFPQILLDSNKNDQGAYSSFDVSCEPDQKVELEGNFSQYFDLYTPKNIQANTLTVLAPNFMQMLIDSSVRFDVEFFGNEMILITRDNVYSPEIMAETLKVLEVQLAYMQRLLASWNYQPLQQPFDTLKYTTIGGSVTKIGKIRIRPSAILIAILFLFFLPIILSIIMTIVSA